MFFSVWVTMKTELLIKDHNVQFKNTCVNFSHFSDLEYSSSIFNILLINFNFILELFNYLEKYWWEMCKHRLQQFKAKGSRHFRHANQPIWLISIYQLHQVLEIIFMLCYTYMWFIIKTTTESFSSENDYIITIIGGTQWETWWAQPVYLGFWYSGAYTTATDTPQLI